MKEVKIVIWDLDDTFWSGTLEETAVQLISGREDVLNELIDRGIMNSISSKNNYEKTKNKLIELGIFDLFIFPNISFEAKGESVKWILQQTKLRAENAIFVDDNATNRKEVEFYNPGIRAVSPEFFNNFDFLLSEEFKGKNDRKRERLSQYKDMERRSSFKKEVSSNKDFLFQSNIVIDIRSDCIGREERLLELVNRTNQLNFTKNRRTKEELHKELLDSKSRAAYILAKDKFGYYGLIGFYLFNDNNLIHFLFSCRVLGLGIEQYVFNKIGCPSFRINGEVATSLKKDEINWICEEKIKEEEDNSIDEEILMIGGCDLEGMAYYLSDKSRIKKEFATVFEGKPFKSSYLSLLLGNVRYNEKIKQELLSEVPFLHRDFSFSSDIFSNKYSSIVLSVVDDYICRNFKSNKDSNIIVSIGDYFEERNNQELRERYGSEEVNSFFEKYTEIGLKTKDEFYKDLSEIIGNIDDKVNIILVNGIDLDVSNWIGQDRVRRNLEMNSVIDRVVSENDNVLLLDMRKIVTGLEELPKHDNRHFCRKVYYQMAQKLDEILKVEMNEMITQNHFIDNLLELKSICMDNDIYCYGAGKYGKALAKWLKDNCDITPYFLETKKEDKVVEEYKSFYPKEIDKDAIVLISTSLKYEKEILSEIHKNEIRNYYILLDGCWKDIFDFIPLNGNS